MEGKAFCLTEIGYDTYDEFLCTNARYVVSLRYWRSYSPRVGSAIPYRWSLRASRTYEDFKPGDERRPFRRLQRSLTSGSMKSLCAGICGPSPKERNGCLSDWESPPHGGDHTKGAVVSHVVSFCNATSLRLHVRNDGDS